MGISIAHGEPIQTPRLTTTPHRLIEQSLMGDTLDDLTILGIVVNHVIRRAVLTEMISQCGIGMTHCHVVIAPVVGESRRLEQQFQINHIVDNHSKLPTVGRAPTPAADTPHPLVETRGKCLSRLDDDITIGLIASQAISLTKRVVHHKSQIVRTAMILHVLNQPRVLCCLFTPEIIVRIFVHLPQRAGEETRAPVAHANQTQRAVFLHTAWHHPTFVGRMLSSSLGILQQVAQLCVGSRKGMIHATWLVIQQEEPIGKMLHHMLLRQTQIIRAFRIQQIQAIQVFGKQVLFIVPLANLLIRPRLHLFSQILGQEIGGLL